MELIVELIVELTVELYSTVSTAPVTRPRPTDVVEHSQLQYTPHVRRRCFYSMQKSWPPKRRGYSLKAWENRDDLELEA